MVSTVSENVRFNVPSFISREKSVKIGDISSRMSCQAITASTVSLPITALLFISTTKSLVKEI